MTEAFTPEAAMLFRLLRRISRDGHRECLMLPEAEKAIVYLSKTYSPTAWKDGERQASNEEE
jgi:hypothetical protein